MAASSSAAPPRAASASTTLSAARRVSDTMLQASVASPASAATLRARASCTRAARFPPSSKVRSAPTPTTHGASPRPPETARSDVGVHPRLRPGSGGLLSRPCGEPPGTGTGELRPQTECRHRELAIGPSFRRGGPGPASDPGDGRGVVEPSGPILGDVFGRIDRSRLIPDAPCHPESSQGHQDGAGEDHPHPLG